MEEDGVVIALTRMNRVLEIDLENEQALVEPGIFNLSLQSAIKGFEHTFRDRDSTDRSG